MRLFLLILILGASSVQAEIKAQGGKITLLNEPAFEKKLETLTLKASADKESLKETGFVIANAQSTYFNDHFISQWISLDEAILKNNSVNLAGVKLEKGLSYGITTTSIDLESQIKVGQEVRIKRYELSDDNIRGRILKIVPRKEQDIIQIHFLTTQSVGLIAGTSCEVEILNTQYQPYDVSLLSLLHLGTEDYIVIKSADGTYIPKHVTVIDQNKTTAKVFLPQAPGQEYVSRGAILLKPLLGPMVNSRNEL